MMRGGEEGNEENDNSPLPTFYTLERQTQTNKEANRSKQSHLIDRSSFNHMGRKDNRTASMRSHAQHAQSSFYHMPKENNGAAQGAVNAQPRAVNHSQGNITSLGNPVGQRLPTIAGTNSIKDSTAAQLS